MTVITTASKHNYMVLNPATGEVLETFRTTTGEEIAAAVTSADNAYKAWKNTPMEERARILMRVAELFTERSAELAQIITTEMGKPLSQAKGEAEFCSDIFRYYAEEGPTLARDQEIKTFSGGRAVVQKLPIGPLLGIMPWNYPYYQVARFAAPNLMLGNTIILKHAASCPRSALAIQQIMDDAGLPSGTYSNVFASREQVAEIIADPRVQGVSLTGSEQVGAIIGETAGRNLKKAVLELGGSDPFIVLDSQDVAGVADTAWDTRMENTGQACNSNKRMIVMADIYEDFVARLVARAQSLKPGDPSIDAAGTYAPMASRTAAETLADQLKDAVQKGATLHVGGELSDDESAYFSPAVLTGVRPGMRAYQEELFGPVAVVYRVGDEAEAVELANDSPYGLGGAVFSSDTDRAVRVAARLEVGMANVNTPAGEGAEIPFGGVKRSGFGRELGPLGMDEFVNKRLFYIAN